MTSPIARSLLGHTLAYGATTVIARLTLVILLVVLPFIVSPREYGALALIMAVNAATATLVPLEITQTVARFYPAATPAAKLKYANSAWWFTLAALLTVGGAAMIAARPLCVAVLGTREFIVEFRLAIAMAVANGVFYFVQNQLRWAFRLRDYSVVSLLFSAATLSLSIGLGMLIRPHLLGIVLGQATGTAISAGYGLFLLRDTIARRFDFGKLAEMLKVSVPLVPASLAMMTNLYVSRLLLNSLASLAAVGIFSFANQIAGIAALVTIGFQGSLLPLVMTHHEDPATPGVLARTLEVFTVIAVLICLCLGLFAPDLVGYFGNPAYAASGQLVLPLAYATVLSQLYIFGPGFLIAKRTGRQAVLSIVAAALCIVGNLVFIPALGPAGAMAANLFAATAFAAMWFVFSQQLYPIPAAWGRMIGFAAGAGVLGFLLNRASLPPIASLAMKAALIGVIAASAVALRLVRWRDIATLTTAGVSRTRRLLTRRPAITSS